MKNRYTDYKTSPSEPSENVGKQTSLKLPKCFSPFLLGHLNVITRTGGGEGF